jgi:hypothetical protein
LLSGIAIADVKCLCASAKAPLVFGRAASSILVEFKDALSICGCVGANLFVPNPN